MPLERSEKGMVFFMIKNSMPNSLNEKERYTFENAFDKFVKEVRKYVSKIRINIYCNSDIYE